MAENTIGTAYVQIIPSSEGISGSLSSVLDGEAANAGESAGKTLGGSLGGSLASALSGAGQVAAGAVAAATTAVTGLATGIMSAASNTAEYGDTIDKMSQKLGMSAEGYQEWDFILQHSGTSISALKPAMKTLTKELASGSEAFAELGLSTKELEGLDKEAQFNKVVAGLQGVEDEAERSRLATELFGRGAMELGPLLNTSAEDTEAMRKQVHDLGGVMSDEAVKNSAAFQDSLQNLQYAMQGLTNNAVSEFLPSITTIMDGLSAAFSGDDGGINMVADGLMSMFSSAGEILPDLIDKGTSLITQIVQGVADNADAIGEGAAQIIMQLGSALIELAPSLLEAAVSLTTSLIDGLISGITNAGGDIGTSGTDIVNFIVNGITTGIPELLRQAAAMVEEFTAGLSESLPGLLDSGVSMITQLVSGLVSGLPEMISAAGELVNSLVNSFITLAPQILSAGVQLIVNLVQGISQSLPDIVASATEVFQQLLTTLLEHLPELITTGIQLVGELAAGLLQALPSIVSAAVTLMAGVIDAILKVDWIKVGVDIIKAIIKGIESMAGEILKALMDIFGKAWEGIKNMFTGKGGNKGKSGSKSASVSSSLYGITDADSTTSEVRNVLLNVKNDDTEKVKNSELTARLDAMLAMMMRYYPDMAEKVSVNGYADIDMIDRDLGMAVM